MRISILRENLVNRYKAKFTPNPKGEGYIYYASETSNGYECSNVQAKEYIGAYAKTLKKYSRLMILWIIIAAIAMGLIQGFKFYMFSKFEMAMYFILPLPIIVTKVMQVYNAPKALQRGKQLSGVRDRKEIIDSRIKSINSSMLYTGLGIAILGVYVTITDDQFVNKIGYITLFALLILCFIYILWRKNKISKQESKILDLQRLQSSGATEIEYVSQHIFVENEEFFFNKITRSMPKRTRTDFWNKIEKLEKNDFRVFEVLHCNTIRKGHTSFHVDWKDTETMLYAINEINKILKLEEFKPNNLPLSNERILKNYHEWLVEKEYWLWQITHGGDFYAGFVVRPKDMEL